MVTVFTRVKNGVKMCRVENTVPYFSEGFINRWYKKGQVHYVREASMA